LAPNPLSGIAQNVPSPLSIIPENPGITWPAYGGVRPLAGVEAAPEGGPGARKSADSVAWSSSTGSDASPWSRWSSPAVAGAAGVPMRAVVAASAMKRIVVLRMASTLAAPRREQLTARQRGDEVLAERATIGSRMQESRRRLASSVRRRLVALVVAAAPIVTVVGAPPAAAPASAALARHYLIGDSVVILVESSLRRKMPRIVVDAGVARQVSDGIAILRRKKRRGTINPHTVFALGTNATFTAEQLSTIIRLTRGHRLYVVTSRCPYCSWTAANNRVIRRGCRPRYHCWVVPFAEVIGRHPGWFAPDGVHLPMDGAGARAYAALVRDTIRASYN
jgi:hypothetical protein